MKRNLLFFCLLAFMAAAAQKTTGKVQYHRATKTKMHTYSDNGHSKESEQIRGEDFELVFDNYQYTWESLPNILNNPSGGEEGGAVVSVAVENIQHRVTDNTIYYNLKTNKVITKRELGNKNYVVEDSVRPLNWKISNETKTILGYTVTKAIADWIEYRKITVMENGKFIYLKQADTSFVTAWFASDIPVSAGPEVAGLPGLILELDVNRGYMVYTAVKISDKIKPNSIKEPKGKRVSMEEFDKERDKILEMEEMRRNKPTSEVNITAG